MLVMICNLGHEDLRHDVANARVDERRSEKVLTVSRDYKILVI